MKKTTGGPERLPLDHKDSQEANFTIICKKDGREGWAEIGEGRGEEKSLGKGV